MVRGAPDSPGIHVIKFYPHMKRMHIVCVLASGMLFALPRLLVQVGRDGIARHTPVRMPHPSGWMHETFA